MRKVYEVKQLSEKDCGPACLLSILKYYKGYVNLERIKIDCKTDLMGTNAYELIKSAKTYGLDGTGKKLNKEMLLENNRIYPYIAQMKIKNLYHFIVVYEVINNKVVIMDPAYGKKTISTTLYLKEATGYILEFFPKSDIVLMPKDTKVISLFFSVIGSEKKLLTKIIFYSFILTIISLFSSFFFKITTDNIDGDITFLKFIVVIFLFITIFKIIVYKLKNYLNSFLNKNIIIKLYENFFYHLFNLPSKKIENKSLGEIVSRLNDLTNIKNAFSEICISVFLDLILTIICLPILYIINAKLFLILLCMLIIYLIIGLFFSKFLYKKIIEIKESENHFYTSFIENLTMFKNIKYLNKTNNVLKVLEYNSAQMILKNFKVESFYNFENHLKNFIYEIGYFAINTYGIYLIYYKYITIVDLVTFNTLMSFSLNPFLNLINNIPKYNVVKASVYKLNEFLAIDTEDIGDELEINSFDITFSEVTFGYNDFSNILENFSLKINYTDHIFLKGKSGKGKSTICRLLIKSYDIKSGEIYMGNHKINDLPLATIRLNIMYVSQKEYLYSATIRENICFYNDVDIEKFQKICQIFKIDQILKNKKLGYDSFIEMDANNFSGGEKQRIVLARACINNFKILIIDEALSEVDLETEVLILKQLRQNFFDKTIIYISHKKLEKYFKRVVCICDD